VLGVLKTEPDPRSTKPRPQGVQTIRIQIACDERARNRPHRADTSLQTEECSMTDSTDDPGLEFPEGHGVSPAEERFHKLGWAVFAGILLAGLAGLLGPGPLSSRTVEAGPVLGVEYERFIRNHAPAELRIRVAPPAGDTIRLHVGTAFLEGTEVTQVEPEPESVEAAPGGQVYVVRASRPAPHETVILYHFEPDSAFSDMRVRIALDGGPEVRFRQFIFP
jgi:hypothetical protein